ncbi:hypothetical protein BH09BAC1_BH09BAC1_04630 [soil metagenome]
MKVEIFGSTDVGQVRDHNEDNFVLCKDLASQDWTYKRDEQFDLGPLGSVLFVADGMGGTNAGEVASEIAQATVDEEFKKISAIPADDQAIMNLVKKVIVKAHQNIVQRTHEDPTTAGMGTTAVLCWVVNDKAYVAWAGDSRMYLYRDNAEFTPITDDHSLVWELVKSGQLTPEDARTHENSNIITQSLGDDSRPPKPDAKMVQLHTGDRVMLCSDGLSGMISDNKLAGILSGRLNTAETCRELIQEANNAGGTDNITVLLLDVLDGNAIPPVVQSASSPASNSSGIKTTIGKGANPINTVASKSGPNKGMIIGVIALVAIAAAIAFFVLKPGASEVDANGLDSLGNPIDTNLSTIVIDTPAAAPITPVEEPITTPAQTTTTPSQTTTTPSKPVTSPTATPSNPVRNVTSPSTTSPPGTSGEQPVKPSGGNITPVKPITPKDTSGRSTKNLNPSDTTKGDGPGRPGSLTPLNPPNPKDTINNKG